MSLALRSVSDIKPCESVKNRRKREFKLRPSVVAIYASVFALTIAIISISYHQPKSETTVASVTNVSSVSQTSVDSTVASNVAAGVAQATNLPVAASVTNLAVSTQTETAYSAQSDGSSATKPQIIESTTSNRSVINYTVLAGDTIDSLAAKYNISKDTIKWANNMTSDALTVGGVMRILPINGVLYTVKSDDTIDSLATKYKVDRTRLVVYNDLDVSGLKVGSQIILPDATMPEDERPGYVAPVATYTYYAGLGTGFGGNTWYMSTGTPDNGLYAHGNCTLYAYNRRIQLGLPVGSHWGNAVSWAENARIDGLLVNHIPSVGAIMQNGGGAGHVAIVESIAANGDISISEMNAYVSGGGYNIVSGRIVLSGNVSQYLYIH